MIVAVVLAALGGMAIAQDKYSVQVPDGLAFSDFRGYEDWQVVSVAMVDPTGPAMSSESGAVLNLIVANPAMIDAYRNGVPDNGRKFPDGSKIVKIQWIPKERRGTLFRECAGNPEKRWCHGEGQQQISGQWRMGICQLQL